MITHLYWIICKARYNAGDWVGPYLYKKMTGDEPQKVTKLSAPHNPHIYSCGSILQFTKPNSIVWGSGFMSISKVPKTITVLAVRGPLTRQCLLKQGIPCPEIYGDPALLLPKFYNPDITKKYRIGIIPHYIEHTLVGNYFKNIPGVLIIDINRPIEQVIDDILSCEYTISTSLHGVIFSHAYKISCMWCRYPNTRMHGGNFKFHDYYLSRRTGRPLPKVITKLPKQCDKLVELIKAYPQPQQEFDTDSLLTACPFGKTLEQVRASH